MVITMVGEHAEHPHCVVCMDCNIDRCQCERENDGTVSLELEYFSSGNGGYAVGTSGTIDQDAYDRIVHVLGIKLKQHKRLTNGRP